MSQTIVFRNVSLSSHLSWGNASGLRQEHSEELWWAAGTLLVSSTSRPGAESLESGSAHKVKMHQISSRQKEIIVFPFSSIGYQWSPMSLIIPSCIFKFFLKLGFDMDNVWFVSIYQLSIPLPGTYLLITASWQGRFLGPIFPSSWGINNKMRWMENLSIQTSTVLVGLQGRSFMALTYECMWKYIKVLQNLNLDRVDQKAKSIWDLWGVMRDGSWSSNLKDQYLFRQTSQKQWRKTAILLLYQ